jgi:hypothetical protein
MADSHQETQRIVVHISRAEILELFMLLANDKDCSGISARISAQLKSLSFSTTICHH